MKPTPPSKRRNPVKVIGEHKFYDIQQADEILHSRFMVAEIQELFLRHGISEGFLREVCSILKDQAIEERDPKKLRENVIAVAQNLEGRLGMLAEKRAYEELACVYFLMDDEPAEYDEEWQAKKKAVWRSAGEADFFITGAFTRINASANISISDILAVWMAVRERHEQLPTLPASSRTTSKKGIT